jgi:hypothetical protein
MAAIVLGYQVVVVDMVSWYIRVGELGLVRVRVRFME